MQLARLSIGKGVQSDNLSFLSSTPFERKAKGKV
jgi:hypothetical protein